MLIMKVSLYVNKFTFHCQTAISARQLKLRYTVKNTLNQPR